MIMWKEVKIIIFIMYITAVSYVLLKLLYIDINMQVYENILNIIMLSISYETLINERWWIILVVNSHFLRCLENFILASAIILLVIFLLCKIWLNPG